VRALLLPDGGTKVEGIGKSEGDVRGIQGSSSATSMIGLKELSLTLRLEAVAAMAESGRSDVLRLRETASRTAALPLMFSCVVVL
jgi:hypothetical protein